MVAQLMAEEDGRQLRDLSVHFPSSFIRRRFGIVAQSRDEEPQPSNPMRTTWFTLCFHAHCPPGFVAHPQSPAANTRNPIHIIFIRLYLIRFNFINNSSALYQNLPVLSIGYFFQKVPRRSQDVMRHLEKSGMFPAGKT